MKPWTLCIGMTPAFQELLEFDSIQLGEVNRSRAVHRSAAGKGVNVARVLRQLGGRPMLLGFIGGDTGRHIAASLRRDGIREQLVRTAQPTRICRTLIDHFTDAVTELVEEGLMPGAWAWTRFYSAVRRNIPATRLMVIAGALMPGADPAVYSRLAAYGVPFLIDSRREPLMATLPYHPIIAKLNVRELEDTIGRRCATERAVLAGARFLLKRGAQHVVVTHGAHGAWLIGSEGAWHYRPPRLNAVNPIGSGDAFTAGICRGLERGQPVIDAVRLGVACGAANALTLLAGHVLRADVERLLRLVRIRAVSRPRQ